MLKDRDFLYREVTQKLPNGVIIIYGQSLSQEEEQQVEGVPCIKGVIRGEMGASGWVIAPLDGGAASSVTYVALTDLKVRHSIHLATPCQGILGRLLPWWLHGNVMLVHKACYTYRPPLQRDEVSATSCMRGLRHCETVSCRIRMPLNCACLQLHRESFLRRL